jgi:hypothetical protein
MAVRVVFVERQLHANAVTLRSLPPEIRAQLPVATSISPANRCTPFSGTSFRLDLDRLPAGFLATSCAVGPGMDPEVGVRLVPVYGRPRGGRNSSNRLRHASISHRLGRPTGLHIVELGNLTGIAPSRFRGPAVFSILRLAHGSSLRTRPGHRHALAATVPPAANTGDDARG